MKAVLRLIYQQELLSHNELETLGERNTNNNKLSSQKLSSTLFTLIFVVKPFNKHVRGSVDSPEIFHSVGQVRFQSH